jgi:hypothetical protein
MVSAQDRRVAGYTLEGATVAPLSTITLQNEQGEQVLS